MKNNRFPAKQFLRGPLAGFLLCGLVSGCLATPFGLTLEPGVYEGNSQGFRGPVKVRAMVSSSGIDDIEILEHNEDESPGGAAMEELRERILEFGYLPGEGELDVISGATASSRGFLEALSRAMESAPQMQR